MNTMRRRVEQRNAKGDVIGVLETTLSDAELAEQDRQAAERRARVLAEGSATITAERRQQQAEAEALAGVGVDADAREHLRDAHRALAGVRDELARRRAVAAAAEAHVGRCQAAHDAAKQVVDGIHERAAAWIVEQLEQGQAPKTPTPTRATEERPETARADLATAIAARDEVVALADAAERAVERAEAQVKEAARGVIRLRVSELSAEIAELSARLEARRGAINSLTPTLYERRWPVPWPLEAAALLTDPEAALDLAEELPEEVETAA